MCVFRHYGCGSALRQQCQAEASVADHRLGVAEVGGHIHQHLCVFAVVVGVAQMVTVPECNSGDVHRSVCGGDLDRPVVQGPRSGAELGSGTCEYPVVDLLGDAVLLVVLGVGVRVSGTSVFLPVWKVAAVYRPAAWSAARRSVAARWRRPRVTMCSNRSDSGRDSAASAMASPASRKLRRYAAAATARA